MSDALPPPAPSDVPVGFQLRAHRWLVVVLAIASLAQWLGLLATFTGFGLVIAVLLTYVTIVQATWRARVSPAGVTFVSPLGVDWAHAWSDLHGPVEVRRPGGFGALARARAVDGPRISVPNGVLTTTQGAPIAAETAQRMIQAWADAGVPAPADPDPTDGPGDDRT